jgi:hypothetical protein
MEEKNPVMKTKAILPATKIPDIHDTIADVFIFESLDQDDEESKRYEGQLLADILRLSGLNPKYYYFQSPSELPHLIGLFRQSRYRYLHISAHASTSEIATSDGNLSYAEFAEYFSGHLSLRRLFVSACAAGNRDFVEAIRSSNKGMHSIVAPTKDIQFDHAAAMWASFYVSIFSDNPGNSIKSKDIEAKLKAMKQLFPVEFFLATYDARNDRWKDQTI